VPVKLPLAMKVRRVTNAPESAGFNSACGSMPVTLNSPTPAAKPCAVKSKI